MGSQTIFILEVMPRKQNMRAGSSIITRLICESPINQLCWYIEILLIKQSRAFSLIISLFFLPMVDHASIQINAETLGKIENLS